MRDRDPSTVVVTAAIPAYWPACPCSDPLEPRLRGGDLDHQAAPPARQHAPDLGYGASGQGGDAVGLRGRPVDEHEAVRRPADLYRTGQPQRRAPVATADRGDGQPAGTRREADPHLEAFRAAVEAGEAPVAWTYAAQAPSGATPPAWST